MAKRRDRRPEGRVLGGRALGEYVLRVAEDWSAEDIDRLTDGALAAELRRLAEDRATAGARMALKALEAGEPSRSAPT